MKYDLGFGNSVCVREAFLQTYHGNMIVVTQEGLSKYDYPDRYGDPELIEITHKVIERQTGYTYNHVFITNGATGAVTIGLRAFAQSGVRDCYTRNAPWYLRYPSMIKAAGLKQMNESQLAHPQDGVILLDMPSNPLGLMTNVKNDWNAKILLDGVYLNRVYTDLSVSPIAHDVMAGSYSKLLGLNGLRVGWIATNDDLLAERIKELVVGEYCGISVASVEILKNTLFDFDWETFEKLAKMNLDINREQFSRLEKFFGGTPVSPNGMFYYGPIDEHCNKLLEKSGISWTQGESLGTDNSFGRFNLGQDLDTVRKAVNAVIRNDLRPTGSKS